MAKTSNRRTILAAGPVLAVGAATQGAAQPAGPQVPKLELAFTAFVQIGPVQQIGPVPGGTARVIPITGGTFEGPRLQGKVLPGGADWQLTRTDGVTELRAHYAIQAEDGAVIQVNNFCLAHTPAGGTRLIRSTLTFEAPTGPHDWLNKHVFVGTLNAPGDAKAPVVIRAFQAV